MASIIKRIADYFYSEQERVLFQFGIIVLFIGLPISTSVIETGKGIIIVSFIISLIRRRTHIPRDPRLILATVFIGLVTVSTAVAVFGPHETAMHNLKRFPGMLAFFLTFVSFLCMFRLKKDGMLIGALFAAMAVNGSVIIRGFLTTHERVGGLFHPVMSNVHIWPALTCLNLGIIAYVRRPLARTLWGALLMMNVLVIACLYSTTAFIVFPIMFVTLIIIIAPKRVAMASVFITLFAVIAVSFMFQNRFLPKDIQAKTEQVLSTRPYGIAERALFWKGAQEIITQHPVVGIGNGLWMHYFYGETAAGKEYTERGMNAIYFHAHNNAMEIAVAYGLPALGVAALFFLFLFVRGITFLRTIAARGHREFFVAAALLIGFASILLQGMTDYTLFAVTGGSYIWAAMGAFIAMEKELLRS